MSYEVGDRVRALIHLVDDLTEHGLGVTECARRGETLIVRRVSATGQSLEVSHENVLDRTFKVIPGEIEKIP